MTLTNSPTDAYPVEELRPTDHGEWIVDVVRGSARGHIRCTLSSYAFGITQLNMASRTLYRTPVNPIPMRRFGRIAVGEPLDLEVGIEDDLGIAEATVTRITLLSDRTPKMTYGDDLLYIWPAGDGFIGTRTGNDKPVLFESRSAAIDGLIFDYCYPNRHDPQPTRKRFLISAPELNLFQQLQSIWPDAISQHRLPFLGSMHVDIFIPSLNAAIEYQGPGHTEPIYGETRLQEQMARDERKRNLCREAGVTLFEVFPGYDIDDLILKLELLSDQ